MSSTSAGPTLESRAPTPPIQPVVTVGDGAALINATVQKNPFNGTWRVAFALKPDGTGRPVELRCFLRKPPHVLDRDMELPLAAVTGTGDAEPMVDLPEAFRPKTGTPESWNAAYVRVEDYLRAHRIHNRLHQIRLIQNILERAARAPRGPPGARPDDRSRPRRPRR